MSKLNLSEVVNLAMANKFPLELIPGETEDSHRFHCLIVHEDFPALSLVFGDEKHGYTFDSAWVGTSEHKGKLRISEAEVRELLESKPKVVRWTRTMLRSNPVRVPLHSTNFDFALVTGRGMVLAHTEEGVSLMLDGALPGQPFAKVMVHLAPEAFHPTLGSVVNFRGKFSLFEKITEAELY